MNDKEKDIVTKEEQSLLETLDKIVRSENVRAQILPIVERVRATGVPASASVPQPETVTSRRGV